MTTTSSGYARRGAGAFSGLLAGAAGVLVGEALAALPGSVGPVVAVGNRVVDLTPRPVKEWAVSTLGSADKVVLVGGVLIILVLAVSALGWIGVGTHRRSALIGMSALVGLAAAAMAVDPGQGAVLAPAAGMGIVGVGGLAWLLSVLGTHGPPEGRGLDRRRFLLAASSIAATGAAGGGTRALAGGTSGASTVTLPRPADPASAVPVGVSFPVPGLTPHLTPNAAFYRVDTALQVPRVSLDDYVLRITGLVDRPLALTYRDLLDRDLVECRLTLTCVSNVRAADMATTTGTKTNQELRGARTATAPTTRSSVPQTRWAMPARARSGHVTDCAPDPVATTRDYPRNGRAEDRQPPGWHTIGPAAPPPRQGKPWTPQQRRASWPSSPVTTRRPRSARS